MRDFLQRTWRTGAVILITGGLILLALSGYLAPVVRLVSDPLVGAQRWLSTRYYAVYQIFSSPTDMTALRLEVDQLRSENASLRGQLLELQELQKDDDVLYALLNVARANPNRDYIPALVIGRDLNPFMRYVLIDRGSDDGLRRGMPVLTGEGLVGRIDAVIANAARVQLISDPDSAVNVNLRGADVDAMLSGSITGDLVLDMVPQQAQIQPGELILTSGLGGTYPSNIIVGQVASVRKLETALFQSASVQPAVDFTELSAVLVVTDFVPVDLTPLINEQSLP